MSSETPNHDPAAGQIGREQQRLDRLDAKEDRQIDMKPNAREAANGNPTETYIHRVDQVQGKIARMHERAALLRDQRKPGWQEMETLCRDAEQKLLSRIEKVDRPTLFQGMADFNNAIAEILQSFRTTEELSGRPEKPPTPVEALLEQWGIVKEQIPSLAGKIRENGYDDGTLRSLHARIALMESLTPSQHKAVLGSQSPVDTTLIVSQLVCEPREKMKRDTDPVLRPLQTLLESPVEAAEGLRGRLANDVETSQKEVDQLQEKEGEMLKHLSDLLKQKDWKGQGKEIESLKVLQKELGERKGQRNALQAQVQQLDIAFARFDAVTARTEGGEALAQRISLRAFERFGPQLETVNAALFHDGQTASMEMKQQGLLRSFEHSLFGENLDGEAIDAAVRQRKEGDADGRSILHQLRGWRDVRVKSRTITVHAETGQRPADVFRSFSPHPLLAPRFSVNNDIRSSGLRFHEPPMLVETKGGFLVGYQEQDGRIRLPDGSLADARSPLRPTTIQAASGQEYSVFLSAEASRIITEVPSDQRVILRRPPLLIHGDGNDMMYRTVTSRDLGYAKREGRTLVVRDGERRPLSSHDIPSLEREDEETGRDVFRAVDREPSIQYVSKQATAMSGGLGEVQSLFSDAMNPKASKSPEFISFLRERANGPLDAVKKVLDDRQLPQQLEQARNRLYQLRKTGNPLAGNDWDQKISERIRAIDGMIDLLKTGGEVRRMLETIVDKSRFTDDGWVSWLEHEGPRIAASIAVAAAAAALVVATCGAAMAPMLVMLASASTATAAGMATYGGVREIQYQWHQHFDEDVRSGKATYTDRPALMAWVTGGTVIDPETGREVSPKFLTDVAGPLALEFAEGVGVMFVTMGLGAKLGEALRSAAGNPKWIVAFSKYASLARLIEQRLANITAESGAGKMFLKEFFKGVTDQMEWTVKESAVGAGLNNIDHRLGAASTFALACLGGFLHPVAVHTQPGGKMMGELSAPKGCDLLSFGAKRGLTVIVDESGVPRLRDRAGNESIVRFTEEPVKTPDHPDAVPTQRAGSPEQSLHAAAEGRAAKAPAETPSKPEGELRGTERQAAKQEQVGQKPNMEKETAPHERTEAKTQEKWEIMSKQIAEAQEHQLLEKIERFNREQPQGMPEQSFKVLRSTEKGIVAINEAGHAEFIEINAANARDVLSRVKAQTERNPAHSGFEVRQECLRRNPEIASHVAYTVGELPKGKVAMKAYIADPSHWIPEISVFHERIFSETMVALRKGSMAMKPEAVGAQRVIVMLRGNTAAGKSSCLRMASAPRLRELNANPDTAINPDGLKAKVRVREKRGGTHQISHDQAHSEGAMMAERTIDQALKEKLNLIVIDKRFATPEDVREVTEMARKNDYKVIMVDVDAELATSIARVHGGEAQGKKYPGRSPEGDDPIVSTDRIEGGYQDVVQYRQEVMKIVDEYYLFKTDAGPDTIMVAEHQGKGMTVHEPQIFKHVTRDIRQEQQFVDRSMQNLRNTSRTSGGVVDTSATKIKADSMAASGHDAARKANENFESVMRRLHGERSRQFSSPRELGNFIEQIALDVNKGILKERMLLRRADSDKFPYTRISDLPRSFENFSQEFLRRLNDPHQNPRELAAWVEFNVDLTHHFFEDGCGKAAKALSAWVLARAGTELPVYRGREEYYGHAPKRSPSDTPREREGQFKEWYLYYSSLFHAAP
ncbi:MAG: zeta toxin family protein [Candidatus Peregrinibacteria bacterium]